MNSYLVVYHDGRCGVGDNVWTALEDALGWKESKSVQLQQSSRGYLWSTYITKNPTPEIPRSSYECCTINTTEKPPKQIMQVFRSPSMRAIKRLHAKYTARYIKQNIKPTKRIIKLPAFPRRSK